MNSLSDLIEQHIRLQLERSSTPMIELKRNRLAERFECAPSQVSYVLETRFTVERGFVVETRRGGGGYVRVFEIPAGPVRELVATLGDLIGDQITEDRAVQCLLRLKEAGILADNEYRLMLAAVGRESIPVSVPVRDIIRARLLRSMIAAICTCEGES